MIVLGLLQTINQTHVSMFSHFLIFTLYRIFTNLWNLFRGSILDIETNMKVNMRKCRLRRIFQVRNNLILTSTYSSLYIRKLPCTITQILLNAGNLQYYIIAIMLQAMIRYFKFHCRITSTFKIINCLSVPHIFITRY